MFKFSGFSLKANSVINSAMNQASFLGHSFVGTEHILWAVLSECPMDFQNIYESQITSEKLLGKLLTDIGRGTKSNLTPSDFSPLCRKILEATVISVKQSGALAEVSTILSFVLREPDCSAVKYLSQFGCDLNALFREVNSYSQTDYKPKQKQKTPSLDKYSKDLTLLAKEGLLDPVLGRDKEMDRVIQILSRRTKNNPCLIGDAGVGKTAIAEGIAQRIASGNVPENIRGKRLCSLDLTLMVAGTKYRGDFEERIKTVLDEVIKSSNIILFIDEVHTIVGAGAAEGAIDASNIMKPQLARGEFQLIGATTTEEYRKYIEKESALERRFQSVLVEEPDKETAIKILEGLKSRYEKFHKISISRESMEAAVSLSVRYLPERRLPDKAIDLIDEACSKKTVENLYYERNLCTEITKDDIAKAVSDATGISAGKISEDEGKRLLGLEKELHKRVAGPEQAVSTVSKAIRRNRTGLRDPKRPIGIFLFMGPAGVGKTELSKALAEVLFNDEKALIRFDMSEYSDKSSVTKLIGAPPGYIGYDDGGKLTEAVHRRPYSVLLFDEIEKADFGVYNLFLQLMDDGTLTDSHGKKVDFTNCIVIMTSNIGAKFIGETQNFGFGVVTEEAKNEFNRKAVFGEMKKVFSPEFINRIDETVVFTRLDNAAAEHIAEKYYKDIKKRLRESGIEAEFSKTALKNAVKNGFSPGEGARPLKRYIRKAAEDPIAEMLLSGEISCGDCILCEETKEGKLLFKKKTAVLN